MKIRKYSIVFFIMALVVSCASKKERSSNLQQRTNNFSNGIPSENTFFNGAVSIEKPILLTTPVTSSKIQAAVEDLTARKNGGILKIPSGIHIINKGILLKSNVHIEINKDARLKMPNTFKGVVFSIGTKGYKEPIKNVKIYSSDANKRYIIDYSNSTSGAEPVYYVSISYVDGFQISDAEILDNETFFSAIRIGPDGKKKNPNSYNRITQNGIIKNCNIQKADYGFGLVQLAAAKNLLFKDISGIGGVTLRLEGSAKGLVAAGFKIGIQEDIYAQNVSCTNGNAALMFSPHAKEHGKVVVLDVTSINCGIGIRVDKGFGPQNGYYSPVPYIGGKIEISSSGSDFVAQIKKKHYKYYPNAFKKKYPYNSLTSLKERTVGDGRIGIPIVPIFHGARLSDDNLGENSDGYYEFTYAPSEEEITGFPSCIPKIANRSHTNIVCD